MGLMNSQKKFRLMEVETTVERTTPTGSTATPASLVTRSARRGAASEGVRAGDAERGERQQEDRGETSQHAVAGGDAGRARARSGVRRARDPRTPHTAERRRSASRGSDAPRAKSGRRNAPRVEQEKHVIAT